MRERLWGWEGKASHLTPLSRHTQPLTNENEKRRRRRRWRRREGLGLKSNLWVKFGIIELTFWVVRGRATMTMG